MLHTVLDDQSRKCCFNSKDHISSPVHKLILENYAVGQSAREVAEAQEASSQITTVYFLALLYN